MRPNVLNQMMRTDTEENKAARDSTARPRSRTLANYSSNEVNDTVDDYCRLHEADSKNRKKNYQSLVVKFYNLVTDFYEFGWGTSFHFAPRRRDESFKQ